MAEWCIRVHNEVQKRKELQWWKAWCTGVNEECGELKYRYRNGKSEVYSGGMVFWDVG